MADTKITGLTALGAAPATGDLIELVDVSDTTMSANGTNKSMTVSNLFNAPVITAPTITTSIVPTSNDGAALGSAANQFSDLFLAEGGVVNFDNGDFTITQAGNDLTFAGGTVVLPAAAATDPGVQLQVGTLQTTPEVGSLELDANALYATTDAGNRGFVPVVHLIRQDSAYTLANSGSAQQLFNASTNGRVTLETGTYYFECLVSLTAMSATSGNATFDLAGTATLGSVIQFVAGRDASSDATAGTISGTYSNDTTLATAPVITAATTTAMFAYWRGTFEVTGAGTVQPRIRLQTAIATAEVGAGSYWRCWRAGSTTLTTIGQWD